jgi:hypothetical protein
VPSTEIGDLSHKSSNQESPPSPWCPLDLVMDGGERVWWWMLKAARVCLAPSRAVWQGGHGRWSASPPVQRDGAGQVNQGDSWIDVEVRVRSG